MSKTWLGSGASSLLLPWLRSKEEQSAAVRALIKAVRERLRAEEDDKAARAAEVQERLASEKAEVR